MLRHTGKYAEREDRALRQGFADPAETKTREGDSDLRDRQIAVQTLQDTARGDGPRVATPGKGLNARCPHFYERKLGGNEETIEGDERQGKRNFQPDGDLSGKTSSTRSGLGA